MVMKTMNDKWEVMWKKMFVTNFLVLSLHLSEEYHENPFQRAGFRFAIESDSSRLRSTRGSFVLFRGLHAIRCDVEVNFREFFTSALDGD